MNKLLRMSIFIKTAITMMTKHLYVTQTLLTGKETQATLCRVLLKSIPHLVILVCKILHLMGTKNFNSHKLRLRF